LSRAGRLTGALRHNSYVDLHRDLKQTVLLLGSGRSGTTWLLESLNNHADFRLIFEPFHGRGPPIAQGFRRRFIPPGLNDPEEVGRFARVLAGRFRSEWSDQYNHSHIVRRRLIKEIQISNLVPWIDAQFPTLDAIVYLIRNPWAVVDSRLELSTDSGLTRWWCDLSSYLSQPQLMEGPLRSQSRLLREIQERHSLDELCVARWCVENYVPIASSGSHRALFVFYEDVVRKPERELSRLCRHLKIPFSADQVHLWKAPSSRTNDRLGTRDMGTRVDRWKSRMNRTEILRFQAVLEAFGLSDLYGSDGLPTVGPDEVSSWARPDWIGPRQVSAPGTEISR
jgi:Sulfotransferase family